MSGARQILPQRCWVRPWWAVLGGVCQRQLWLGNRGGSATGGSQILQASKPVQDRSVLGPPGLSHDLACCGSSSMRRASVMSVAVVAILATAGLQCCMTSNRQRSSESLGVRS